jgi:sialic acid synthase SpsE
LLPKKYIKKGEVIKGDMLVIKRLGIGNRAIYFKKIIDTIVKVNI